MKCTVCPHHCDIKEGQSGICHARTCEGGIIKSRNYGQVTSLALDPIEKKPLNRFYPGSWILSLGSWGCNLNCPWCQNDSISRGEDWAEDAGPRSARTRRNFIQLTPEEVVEKAIELKADDNIGIAFTYNEPMICPEFLTDTARLAHEKNLKNVLVTNGMIEKEAHETFLLYIDAYNIDLKTSSAENYRAIGGDLDAIVATIRRAASCAHVEVTNLVVPGFNDTEEEIRKTAGIIAEIDRDIPLHVTRFFPAGRMRNAESTDVRLVYRFAEIAREYLTYVYTGNC